MKTGFILTSLVLAAGVPTAVAADAFGLLPASVSSVLTLPAVLGWYTAAGVVAMAWREYAPRREEPRKHTRSAATVSHAAAAAPAHDWVYQTISA